MGVARVSLVHEGSTIFQASSHEGYGRLKAVDTRVNGAKSFKYHYDFGNGWLIGCLPQTLVLPTDTDRQAIVGLVDPLYATLKR